MIRPTLVVVVVAAALPLHTLALNDWDKPCFKGECSYDLRENGKTTATLRISGSPHAIADITPAGGWAILGCDPNAGKQDIRIVCQDTDTTKCEHLFSTIGVEGKLVRLPDNCGSSAFARVAANWVHKDQNLPSNIRDQFKRRGVVVPTVHGVSLDTDFAAIDAARTGEVTMTVIGSTSPLEPATRVQTESTDFVETALQGFSKSFDKSKTTDLTLVDVNNHYPIYSQSFDCPAKPGEVATSGKIDISVDAKVHVALQIGVVAKGTIIPPKVKEFALFTGLDADLNAQLHMAAEVSGTLDSGEITLYQYGLPKIEFKDILSIDSGFKLLGEASATLSLAMDLTVGVVYQARSEKMFWPKGQPSGGAFDPGSVPLKLSVSESISASGSVGVHVIPRAEIRIEAFKGIAKAKVFLDLDASVTMPFNVQVDLRENEEEETNAPHPAVHPGPSNPPSSITSSRFFPHDLDLAAPTSNEVARRESPFDDPSAPSATSKATNLINGCFKVLGGLDVHAGADAKFFDIFDKGTKVTLFSKRFGIYQKCFSAKATHNLTTPKPLNEKRDLTCLKAGLSGLIGLADQVVPSGSISPI